MKSRSVAVFTMARSFVLLAMVFPTVALGGKSISAEEVDWLLEAPWAGGFLSRAQDRDEGVRLLRDELSYSSAAAEKARESNLQLPKEALALLDSERRRLEMVSLKKDYASRLKVTDEQVAEVARHYRWDQPLPDRYSLHYIFIDSSDAESGDEQVAIADRAKQVRSTLTVENFGETAELWSDAPSSAVGGSLGLVDLSNFGPTFRSHVLQTAEGTISDPLRTASGWNIIYVADVIPGGEPLHSESQIRRAVPGHYARLWVEKLSEDPEAWAEAVAKLPTEQRDLINRLMAEYEEYLLARLYENETFKYVEPTESELLACYEKQKSSHIRPAPFMAREILITDPNWSNGEGKAETKARIRVRNRARELRSRILAGEIDFAEAAREYSAAASAASGGDIGWVAPPTSAIYDQTLANLEMGEISPPKLAGTGYLLLKLEDRGTTSTMPFEQLSPYCRTRLIKDQYEAFRMEVLSN